MSRWHRFLCFLGLHPAGVIVRDPDDLWTAWEECPRCGHRERRNLAGGGW